MGIAENRRYKVSLWHKAKASRRRARTIVLVSTIAIGQFLASPRKPPADSLIPYPQG
jgi:hypothetical protein